MSEKYYTLDMFTNHAGPLRIDTKPDYRIAAERVGDLGGDCVLRTKQGDIVVPEGAYRVYRDDEEMVLE